MPSKRPRLSTVEIYQARTTGIRAALPKDRSQQFCGETCYTERNGDASTCDGMTSCWAKSIGASSRLTSAAVYAQRRLDLERGRVPAPRPRSLADVARNYYAQPERRAR
jgi:hypothetical protein